MINKNKFSIFSILLGIIIGFGLVSTVSAADLSNTYAKNVGGNGVDVALASVVDTAGNTYITGYFEGTADFDPSSTVRGYTSKGAGDVFIQKVNSSGNLVWVRRIGGTSDEHGNAISLDTDGNVYITGYFNGTADFDPGEPTVNLSTSSGANAFVLKLDSNGRYVWAKNMGGNSWTVGNSIAVDANGNVYTKGLFAGTADFDPGAGTANMTAPGGQTYLDQVYISKLDASGNYVWAKNFGGNLWDTGYSLVLDSNANIYSTGYFEGTADFDPSANTANLTSAGSDDIYVLKLDTDANYVWAKKMGGSGSDVGTGLQLDSNDNVIISGYFNGTADFDPSANTANLTSAGAKDVFISVIDNSGNYIAAVGIGSTGDDQANSINIDSSNNVYIAGQFEGTVDFAPGATTRNLTSNGGKDIFFAKFDLVQ